jgi:hypothetical protein
VIERYITSERDDLVKRKERYRFKGKERRAEKKRKHTESEAYNTNNVKIFSMFDKNY